MAKKITDIDEIFKKFMDEGIIIIGCVGLTKDSQMFSRILNPLTLSEVLKEKEAICVEINDSLLDNTKHLCKSMDLFIEQFCKLTGIPQGRTYRKAKATTREGF